MVDEKIETYKVRLIAKCYSQKLGFDCEETFSPIVMLKSIRIFLSIATHLDYKIWLKSIKTMLLNDYLDENLYMM